MAFLLSIYFVNQVITSLARTGILFQNSVNIFKLLIITLNGMLDKCLGCFVLFSKFKACVLYFL